MYLRNIFQTEFAIVVVSLATLSGAWAQSTPAHPGSVPIYNVTVVSRTVNAVNYQYRSGPTQIAFAGTVLLPKAKGDATVESKAGRTEIVAHFEHLVSPQRFGTEYLTYVLWAVTPQGNVKNLGEILSNSSDKGNTRVTTNLQTFGLIVTAEPYSSVRQPSDVVVMENHILPETIGGTEPIQARFELMPRGSYTYETPAGPPPEGPKVSMSNYEQMLELDQASNAIQIAEAQGAAQYAPDVLAKAKSADVNALQLQSSRANKNAVITAARDATQTAEDARALTIARKHDAELAGAQKNAERADQLRLDAEARAQSAQSVAAAALAEKAASDNALKTERQKYHQAEQDAEMASVSPPPAAPVVTAPTPAIPAESYQISPATLRGQLLARLTGPLETLDTGRGLEVILNDSNFQGVALTPSAAANLGTVVGIVVSHPGLQIEVDGNSDMAGDAGQTFSLDRANAVRDALMARGLDANRVTANGLGDSRLFGPNTTAQGREKNRRVEVIISGAPIGNEPVWNKPYSLDTDRVGP